MDLKQFEEHLKKKQPLARFILLESGDAYVMGRVLSLLRQHLFNTEDLQAINSMCQEESLRVTDHPKDVVTVALTALQTLPMFSACKLVVVREGDELTSEQEQALIDHFQNDAASKSTATHLLLQSEKVRANSKLKKYVEAHGLFIAMSLQRKPQFEEAIRNIAEQKGVKLDAEIIRFLAEYVPMDLNRVEGEVEKLALYAGKDGKVDLRSASELVCSTNLESVFRMTDALGERNPRLALEILFSMLERGESPQMLLAMLARHMRHLYRVKLVERLRVSRDDVAEALETHSSFVIEKAQRHARAFALDGLRRAMQLLYESDRDMKSTGIAPQILLEKLVKDLSRLTVRA